MSSSIATVTSIAGNFLVKGVDGSLRELSFRDSIYEGEVVVGVTGNSSIDSVIITMLDGTDIVMLGEEQQAFDSSLSNIGFSPDEVLTESSSVEAIIDDEFIFDEILDDINTEFAQISNQSDAISAELRSQDVTSNSSKLDTDNETLRNVLQEELVANVQTLLSNVLTLQANADDAAQTANEAATLADTVAATAESNPTPTNLASAEIAQKNADDAAIDATNAANSLAAANNSADAANEAVANAESAADTLAANDNPTAADIQTANNAVTAADKAIDSAEQAKLDNRITFFIKTHY